MDELKKTIEAFAERQSKITKMWDESRAKQKAIMADFEKAKVDFQGRLDETDRDVKNEFEKYKADLKTTFGITDGEKANVLDFVKVVYSILEKTKK